VIDWIRDAHGDAALDEVLALSFAERRAGMLDPGTEPIEARAGGATWRMKVVWTHIDHAVVRRR
jgi:hypothetical protein